MNGMPTVSSLWAGWLRCRQVVHENQFKHQDQRIPPPSPEPLADHVTRHRPHLKNRNWHDDFFSGTLESSPEWIGVTDLSWISAVVAKADRFEPTERSTRETRSSWSNTARKGRPRILGNCAILKVPNGVAKAS